MTRVLDMELSGDAFPEPEGFVVDVAAGTGAEVKLREEGGMEGEAKGMQKWKGKGMVSVVGKGRFTSKKTGKSWEEVFCYRFSGFDDEGKIGWWEVWANSLSAWVAVGGEE
jgi:hypothetical protein